ncbi:hypothetical protein B0H11DRAFT_1916869 [Mycena galericulata]|nr:hypothetical protein B0H11DRAFT_1916869 [Mycena galericulata]
MQQKRGAEDRSWHPITEEQRTSLPFYFIVKFDSWLELEWRAEIIETCRAPSVYRGCSRLKYDEEHETGEKRRAEEGREERTAYRGALVRKKLEEVKSQIANQGRHTGDAKSETIDLMVEAAGYKCILSEESKRDLSEVTEGGKGECARFPEYRPRAKLSIISRKIADVTDFTATIDGERNRSVSKSGDVFPVDSRKTRLSSSTKARSLTSTPNWNEYSRKSHTALGRILELVAAMT